MEVPGVLLPAGALHGPHVVIEQLTFRVFPAPVAGLGRSVGRVAHWTRMTGLPARRSAALPGMPAELRWPQYLRSYRVL